LSHHEDFPGSVSGASLSALQPTGTQPSQDFEAALNQFLARHPEVAADPRRLEVVRYCYKYYVNYDPQYRDLPINDKLKQAIGMAGKFFGAMSSPKP
jgi:hypothetical protein